jgi:micrococcal nuclease
MTHISNSISLLFFIAMGLSLLPTSISHAQMKLPKGEDAVVTEIVDGDTINVTIGEKAFTVRYIGIDAPETNGGDSPQCYAREATEANRILVKGQTLRLVKDRTHFDRYGRLLRYAFLSSGVLVNEALVKDGFAFAKRYKPDTRRAVQLERAQAAAKKSNAGMWGVCDVSALLGTQPTPFTSAPAQSPAPPPPASSSGEVSPVDAWNCPPSHPIKGNRNSMIYHTSSSRYYSRTKPESCFSSEADAVAAGFRAPKK